MISNPQPSLPEVGSKSPHRIRMVVDLPHRSAQKSEDFSFFHLKVDMIHGHEITERSG